MLITNQIITCNNFVKFGFLSPIAPSSPLETVDFFFVFIFIFFLIIFFFLCFRLD